MVIHSPPQADLVPQPWLSIVIPALESDLELTRCIASVRLALPDTADYELVLVMPEAATARARSLFPSARVFAERRRGIYAAMNQGAALSTGRYLYFIGKDDILLPTARDALAYLVEHRPTGLFCDVYWGSKGIFRGLPSKWRVLGRNLCHQGIIYERGAFETHGPYLTKMRVQADHLVNIKLLWDRKLPHPPAYLPVPLAWYSGSGFSVIRAADPVFWRLYPTVMRRYVGRWAAIALTVYRRGRGR